MGVEVSSRNLPLRAQRQVRVTWQKLVVHQASNRTARPNPGKNRSVSSSVFHVCIFRSFATTETQLKIYDFSGETFKDFEVL